MEINIPLSAANVSEKRSNQKHFTMYKWKVCKDGCVSTRARFSTNVQQNSFFFFSSEITSDALENDFSSRTRHALHRKSKSLFNFKFDSAKTKTDECCRGWMPPSVYNITPYIYALIFEFVAHNVFHSFFIFVEMNFVKRRDLNL